MPVEETENEIRIRVQMPDDFKRLAQIFPNDQSLETYPYNKMGIRGLGGPLKSSGDVKVQVYLFSKKDRYDWTPRKAEQWVRDQDETPKGYSDSLDDITFDYDFPIEAVKSASAIPDEDRVKVPKGVEVAYIEGPLSTDDIDSQGDKIDQGSIDFEDFKKNPVLLFQHKPEYPIGKVLRIKRNVDLGNGRRGFWVRAAIIGDNDKAREILRDVTARIIRGFSIRGKAYGKKVVCAVGKGCHNVLMGLRVIEGTVTSLPANPNTLFSVVKSLMDIQSPTDEDVVFGGHDIDKEEARMSEQDGTPDGARKQELQMPPELLEQLEALNKNVANLADRMTKIETEIAALKKPEPEGEGDQEGETTDANKDPVKATTTPPDAGAGETAKKLVEVEGVKKAMSPVKRERTGADTLDVQKSSRKGKELAAAIWNAQHPK